MLESLLNYKTHMFFSFGAIIKPMPAFLNLDKGPPKSVNL